MVIRYHNLSSPWLSCDALASSFPYHTLRTRSCNTGESQLLRSCFPVFKRSHRLKASPVYADYWRSQCPLHLVYVRSNCHPEQESMHCVTSTPSSTGKSRCTNPHVRRDTHHRSQRVASLLQSECEERNEVGVLAELSCVWPLVGDLLKRYEARRTTARRRLSRGWEYFHI